MTGKDRILRAIQHEETEHVPSHIDVTPPVRRQLMAYLATDDLAAAMRDDLAIVGAGADKPLYADPELVGETVRDEFGVLWRAMPDDRGCVAEHALPAPSLEGYTFPDPLRPGRFDQVRVAVEQNGDRFVLGVAGDLFERANFMRGLDLLLMDFLLEPAFAHALLDGICEYALRTLDRMAEFDVDGIFISDDYGLQHSLMMRPATWRELVGPRLARLIAGAKRHGLPTVLHSCGCVVEIIPDLIDMGLDVLHPIQPEAMDVWELKREFGRDLCFFGGIGTQELLRNATPQVVRQGVERAKTVLGQGGGYIVGPGITIQKDCPIENVLALIDAANQPRTPA